MSLCVPFGNSLQTFTLERQMSYSCFICEALIHTVSLGVPELGEETGRSRWAETYGTISSCNPLRKRIGTFVISGIASSLAQIW